MNKAVTAYGIESDSRGPKKGVSCSLYINATIDLCDSSKDKISLSGEIHILTHNFTDLLIFGNNILRPAKPIIALNADGSGKDLLIVDDVAVVVRSLKEPIGAVQPTLFY
jgi:hypothetical protein